LRKRASLSPTLVRVRKLSLASMWVRVRKLCLELRWVRVDPRWVRLESWEPFESFWPVRMPSFEAAWPVDILAPVLAPGDILAAAPVVLVWAAACSLPPAAACGPFC